MNMKRSEKFAVALIAVSLVGIIIAMDPILDLLNPMAQGVIGTLFAVAVTYIVGRVAWGYWVTRPPKEQRRQVAWRLEDVAADRL